MSLIDSTLRKTIGANASETDLLNFIAESISHSNPTYASDIGDGSGAWGVSQRWYGVVTPRDSVPAQAAQALGVLRERSARVGSVDDWPGAVCYYTAMLALWWEPGLVDSILSYKDTHGDYPTADAMQWDDSKARAWIGVTSRLAEVASKHWIWLLVGVAGLGVAIWLIARHK